MKCRSIRRSGDSDINVKRSRRRSFGIGASAGDPWSQAYDGDPTDRAR